MDSNAAVSSRLGVPTEKIEALNDYAKSPLFTEAEKVALEYADAITDTRRDVEDELFARLQRHYDDDTIAELTMIIAWENASSRFNRAFRIPSQGFWKPARRSRLGVRAPDLYAVHRVGRLVVAGRGELEELDVLRPSGHGVRQPRRDDVAVAGLQLVLAVAMVVEAHPALEDIHEEKVELGVLVLGDRRLRGRHTLDHVGVVRAAGGLLHPELPVEELRPGRAVVRFQRLELGVLEVGDEERLPELALLHDGPPDRMWWRPQYLTPKVTACPVALGDRRLDLSVELYDVPFRIAEEKGAMSPVGDVPWRAQDRHTLGLQRLVTSVDHVRRDPEGELDRSRAGSVRTILPRQPWATWAQGEQRRADLKAHPALTVMDEREAHDGEIEVLGLLHVRTQQNGVVEVAYVAQNHEGARLLVAEPEA